MNHISISRKKISHTLRIEQIFCRWLLTSFLFSSCGAFLFDRFFHLRCRWIPSSVLLKQSIFWVRCSVWMYPWIGTDLYILSAASDLGVQTQASSWTNFSLLATHSKISMWVSHTFKIKGLLYDDWISLCREQKPSYACMFIKTSVRKLIAKWSETAILLSRNTQFLLTTVNKVCTRVNLT